MKLRYEQWEPERNLGSPARMLTLEEQGLYRLLRDIAWAEGPARDAETPPTLPNDQEELAFLAGVDAETFARSWPRVSRFFPQTEDGRLAERLQLEKWESALQSCRTRKDAARTAALARWSEPDAKRMRDASAPQATGCDRVPIEIETEIETKTGEDDDPEHTGRGPVQEAGNGNGSAGHGDDVDKICSAWLNTTPTSKQRLQLDRFLQRFYSERTRAPALARICSLMRRDGLGFGWMAERLKDPEALRRYDLQRWAQTWSEAQTSLGPGARSENVVRSVAGLLGVEPEALEMMTPVQEGGAGAR